MVRGRDSVAGWTAEAHIATRSDQSETTPYSGIWIACSARGRRRRTHATYPYVCIDDLTVGRQVMDHLLKLGHRRIGMIECVQLDHPSEPTGRSNARALHFAA